ncbi:hypothetical protein [Conexibacter woesei]|uniref:hypothetical protein n=1 Tax=Conexibacter woesei TaxID=191495 RepID=UPI0012DD6F49|nr:hypothetical protein [Conexibacter woesei]
MATLAVAAYPAAAAGAATAGGREYEQVTPVDKDFGFGQFARDIAVVNDDGSKVAFDTFGPMPGAVSAAFENMSIGQRTSAGWTSKSISPPQEPLPGGFGYPLTQAFSPDLGKAVILTARPALTPDATPGLANLYLQDIGNDSYRLLTKGPVTGDYGSFARFGGASKDFSHLVFEAQDQLLPDAPATATVGTYEWVDGQLRNVGIRPDGTPADTAILGGGAALGGRVSHAVSDDGRRIFFSESGALYVRIDGSSTKAVSASQRTVPDPLGPGAATFWAATADGSTVYFTSPVELTDDATTGDDGSGGTTDAGNDLYAFDVASGHLTDLTVDANSADSATGAAVQGVVGASDDGSYIYVVAQGALADGATSGAMNLYVLHAGTTKFIATLDPTDAANWSSAPNGPLGVTSRVTPDGRFALLLSVGRLTSYDNTDPLSGTPRGEIYRYSADDENLVCVSCRVDGSPPSGDARITPPANALFSPTQRNITSDGQHVFFDTTDAVVREDTNGHQDVYEWSDSGPALVSTGTSGFDATFQDATPSGSDVLFSTQEQLVGQDIDTRADLYDARVGGGFPPPPTPDEPCIADACQGDPAAVAPLVPAATVTFFGIGNVAPADDTATATRKVSVTKPKTVRGTKTTLKVKVPAKGAVSVSGEGLHTTKKAATKAQTVTVTVQLSKRSIARLKQHSSLKLVARVAFKPSKGSASTTHVSLTFKPAVSKKKGRS